MVITNEFDIEAECLCCRNWSRHWVNFLEWDIQTDEVIVLLECDFCGNSYEALTTPDYLDMLQPPEIKTLYPN